MIKSVMDNILDFFSYFKDSNFLFIPRKHNGAFHYPLLSLVLSKGKVLNRTGLS